MELTYKSQHKVTLDLQNNTIMCDVGELCAFTKWMTNSPKSTVLGKCDDETFKDIPLNQLILEDTCKPTTTTTTRTTTTTELITTTTSPVYTTTTTLFYVPLPPGTRPPTEFFGKLA